MAWSRHGARGYNQERPLYLRLYLVLVVYGPGAIITLDQAPPDYIKIASLITLTYDDS